MEHLLVGPAKIPSCRRKAIEHAKHGDLACFAYAWGHFFWKTAKKSQARASILLRG
ncbi:hypothetical protein RRSWK_04110 [Rhodopirellula sp. SWK7]|nr:hypothetical protein RRSWK_04110 [Rhodopirellula sp. SWK7]